MEPLNALTDAQLKRIKLIAMLAQALMLAVATWCAVEVYLFLQRPALGMRAAIPLVQLLCVGFLVMIIWRLRTLSRPLTWREDFEMIRFADKHPQVQQMRRDLSAMSRAACGYDLEYVRIWVKRVRT